MTPPDPMPPAFDPQSPAPSPLAARAGGRAKDLPSLAPDPTPSGARSRFDEDNGVVLYNDAHHDYLTVKDDEPALLDYLATLVAKEYVVFNNPRAPATDLAEEMVRVLVRVRRYLPKRA